MKRTGKFNAVRVKADGYTFDSKAEYERYMDLKILERACLISELRVHPLYPLEVKNKHIATYEADFSYRDHATARRPGTAHTFHPLVVEDVKGFPTPEYKIKRELFKALYADADFRELSTDRGATRKSWTARAKELGAK